MNLSETYDVAVIGGGAAGVAAAASAADGGGRVLLVEGSDRLGGSVSAAMHRSLCGLYSHAPAHPLDTLNAGSQREVVSRMAQLGEIIPKQLGRTWVLEFPSTSWETALVQVIAKDNIDRVMQCRVTGIRCGNSKIVALQLESNRWINTCALIDCTGGGVVLQMIGERVMLPADAQRMLGGFSVRLAGLSGDLEMLRLQTPYVLTQAVEAKLLDGEARFTMFQPGPGTVKASANWRSIPSYSHRPM